MRETYDKERIIAAASAAATASATAAAAAIVGSDIAVIKNQITNLSNNFEEYKDDNKKFCENITNKVNSTENKQIATETKVSNLAIFQSIFSIIIGGIATYLGGRR